MNTTTKFAIKVANLSYYSIEASKLNTIQAFKDILLEEGGDDTFAHEDPNHVAIALIMALPPISYASLEGRKLSYEVYLQLYLEAKERLLAL